MKKELIPFAVMALAMASCSSDDVVDVNPDPSGDALSFSIAVGHSRATETTITNLGDFRIVAKGVHPHGGLYDSFLIGDEDAGELAFREEALSEETIDGVTSKYGKWELGRNVYWPTSMEKALFWAYTCSQLNKDGETETKSAVLPDECKFKFYTSSKCLKVESFSPSKADLTAGATEDAWADGLNQVDFVTAFKESEQTSNVALNFGHVLSQINIMAKSGNKKPNDSRIVKIRGAWLVNTRDKADLTSTYSWNDDTKEATHELVWNNFTFKDGSFSAYGSFYTSDIVLDKNTSGAQNLLYAGRSLMLIPQQITAWDKNAEHKTDAYILLLCRVELEHSGTTHTGSDNIDDIVIKDGKHYHQQFPVNAGNKFDATEYGFVCVPVGITADMDENKKWSFEIGKKYTFNLDICGDVSGAGIYPPEDNSVYSALLPSSESAKITIGTRPGSKKIGEAVLDAPITFKVTVSAWDENNTWTQGGVEL